jgi:hypothetical protein
MFNRAISGKWLWHYMHEREAWWILNLVVHGVGGVLMSLLGPIGWDYQRISRGLEDVFQSY